MATAKKKVIKKDPTKKLKEELKEMTYKKEKWRSDSNEWLNKFARAEGQLKEQQALSENRLRAKDQEIYRLTEIIRWQINPSTAVLPEGAYPPGSGFYR